LNGPIPADPDSATTSWLSTVTGCEIRSTEWIGIDFGLSGHCCRVIGRNPQGEEVDVVVKLTTEPKAAREIAFYRHYAPDTPIATPRFLGGEIAGDRGYLVLETVVEATQGDVLAGTSRRGAEAMAGALARLHGRWWNDDSDLERLRLLSPPKRSEPPVLIDETVDHFLDVRAGGLSVAHRNLIATLRSRLHTIHRVLWGGARTLIHTDAHLDNVLWMEGEPVFLDWEGAMVGPPEIDVARLLIEGMTPAQYGEFGAMAVETYRTALSRTGEGREMDDARLAAATLRSLAGIVGWIGGRETPPPGRRTRRLGRNALRATLTVYDSLAAATDL
jgi:hypothetical protein